MIKRLLVFANFIILFGALNAQTYGNEWINYSQKYFKFPITQTGIYKIDYDALVAAGVDINAFSSQNMQVFGRDKEQPIYVFDNNDNQMNPGDYFIFIADKNDGWLDSTLYEDPSWIGNPGKSMFSDTIYYFFTYNNSTSNLRYSYENFTNYTDHTESPYVFNRSILSYSDYYNIGYNSNAVALSSFTPGEGPSSGLINGGGTTNGYQGFYYFNTPNKYTGIDAPFSIFHGKSNSNSNASSDSTENNPDSFYNHHLNWTIGQFNYLITDTIFRGYQQNVFTASIPNSHIGTGSTVTNFNIVNDLSAETDYQTISYMSLYYPMNPVLDGSGKNRFWVRDNISSMVNLNLSNTGLTNPICLVRNGATAKFVNVSSNGSGGWRALFSRANNSKDQEINLYDNSQIIAIDTLSKVTESGFFTNYQDQFADSANIIIYHPSLKESSDAYKQYRSQNYNVVYANIEELYLQYGGGIPKHNASIRRFAKSVYDNSTIKPIALTLLGKGYTTRLSVQYPSVYNANLIPCFGHPGSDQAFTSNLYGSGNTPLIPTGRISVNTNELLSNYLEKLITYENQQNQSDVYSSETKDWQKQAIHFVGGNPGWQNEYFESLMNNWKNIIEDTIFAGNITTYSKKTSDPLDPSLLGQLSDILQNGVSLMTFLGHSSANGFDLTIDEPQNWNNTDKYPIVYGNGCYSGAIYSADNTFGEKLIRVPSEGAIAYIGSADQEYDVNVNTYSIEFYKQFAYKNYGKPLAYQMQQTIRILDSLYDGTNQGYYNPGLISTLGATNLNGDPLLKLNWHTKPEIEIIESSVAFNPANLDLTIDSFEVRIKLKNLGISIKDSFNIILRRSFPNSQYDSVYSKTVSHLNYMDTVVFKLPLQAEIATGINQMEIKVDLDNDISIIEEQYDEINNNQITKTLFLKLDALVPIKPYKFAVIPYDTTTLIASTINPVAHERTYLFELDTTDTYDSPQKRVFSTTGLGGLKSVNHTEWKDENGNSFPLICQDSMVYFWRTCVDSTVKVWTESSFQYINNKSGWGQDHFFQFKENNFSDLTYDRTIRKRKFVPTTKNLKIDVYDNLTNISLTAFWIDNQYQEGGMCWLDPSLHLIVIDPETLKPWKTVYNSTTDQNPGHFLNNINHQGACRPRQESYFIYRQDSIGLNNLNNVILNQIPNGFYYAVYAVNYVDYNSWNQFCPTLYQTFSNEGGNLIQTSNPDNCFIFYTRKGYPEFTQEIIAENEGDLISIETDLDYLNFDAQEVSPLIGPSQEWETLYWKQSPEEFNTADSTRLVVELYNIELQKLSEIDTIFSLNDSIIDLQNLISAQQYPYIKLKAKYYDNITVTPAQNNRWHVLFTPVPEAAIDGSNGFTLTPIKDSILEGEEMQFAIDVKNISDYHMDSILINYWIEDKGLVRHNIAYPRQDSLRIGATFRDTISFSTLGYPGLNSLWMEVNPFVNGSQYIKDQPEQYHFNNVLQVPFYVIGDDENPILDVTFDGRHILNGDIVNPLSEIVISLKDDNEFLIMDSDADTTLFGVFLTDPYGVITKIPFMDQSGNIVMQWIPAESNHKRFKIIYPASFMKDGTYTLLVQGSDRSGNLSGDLEYRINFEVINESTITHLMNYPNPFSTSTQFVFTLTGSEVPDDIYIQILNVSGKVVRQINEQEIGPIYIGRNITQFAWDGRDDFGDQLANGVYLYRVISKINGEEIKHRETSADQFFTKGFGKMYLMR